MEKGYTLTARKFNSRNERTGPVARTILRYFIRTTPLSAYDIFLLLKRRALFNSYKNVHKRVHRLLTLNLIVKDKKFKSNRRTIKYRMTSEGLFYLLLYTPMIFQEDLKCLLTNYGDDKFFNEFIYPYLGRETILNLSDDGLFIAISDHMRDCCYQLNAILDYEHENSNPEIERVSRKMALEPPMMQVSLLPLTLKLLNACKFVKKNEDMKILAQDNAFMKSVVKNLQEYEVVRDRLSKLRM